MKKSIVITAAITALFAYGHVNAQDTFSYTVNKGDSWESIAERYGMALNDILVINNKDKNSVLKVNDRILVFDKKSIIQNAMNKNTDKTSNKTPPTNETAKKNNEKSTQNKITTINYTVQPNDNFYSIAKKHNITFSELRKLNPEIKNIEKIIVRQVIQVPNQKTATKKNSNQDISSYSTHMVLEGETLMDIAKKYKISPNDLIRLNAITDPNNLRFGIILRIPATQKQIKNLENAQRR